MGSWFSSRIKPETPLHHHGEKPTHVGNISRKPLLIVVPSNPNRSSKILEPSNLRRFCYDELQEATNYFSRDYELGFGGFRCVFQRWVDDRKHPLKPFRLETGMVFAVEGAYPKSCYSQEEWLAETRNLGKLSHPNVAKLIGYCLDDHHRHLVYEFIPHSNLENHLYGTGFHRQPLSWNHYMKISLGVAKGLAFLHHQAHVIYKDFKASKILLDSDYNAKLYDFGFAKDGPSCAKRHSFARFLGTAGHAAPEYMSTGHASAESDVYSYGVVLLEILTGKQAICINKPTDDQDLDEFARSLAGDCKFSNPADLGKHSTDTAVLKVAQLAIQCVSPDPNLRPNMKQVVEILEQL